MLCWKQVLCGRLNTTDAQSSGRGCGGSGLGSGLQAGGEVLWDDRMGGTNQELLS